MDQRRSFALFATVATLVCAAGQAARAAPPPDPWIPVNIGAANPAGSSDLDAAGVWTVKSSGELLSSDPGGNPTHEDSFHFAYQRIKGDASITARFLSRSESDAWEMSGVMIRTDDSASAPYVNLAMTGGGLFETSRVEPGVASGTTWQVGPDGQPTRGLVLRLQRVGSEVAGFYSRDGKMWSQAGFSPRLLPSLKEEALYGLAAASNTPGRLATGKFDQVDVHSGAELVYGVRASGLDHAVVMEWRLLPGAVGYNLYRGTPGTTETPQTRLNDSPITSSTFTDRSDVLANGTPVSYGIAPVIKAADGSTTEGPLVVLRATPVAAPPGFSGCSINEVTKSGSVAVDAATSEITLRGAGSNVWFTGDQCYFLYRPVEGNARITVKAVTKPSNTSGWAKAGLMLRDSLDGAARFAFLCLTPKNGLVFQWRTAPNDWANWPDGPEISPGELKPPITIRLIRRGNSITPEYSTDDGKSFVTGEPVTWEGAVPQTLYVGLAITATNLLSVAQEKFSGLVVE